MKTLIAIIAVLLLAGCASPSLKVVDTEHYRLVVADTGVGVAGGPRIKQMLIEINGQPVAGSSAAGPGSFQTAIPVFGGVAQSAIDGVYFERGMEARRPDETSVSTSAQGGSASGGHGGSAVSGSGSESHSGAGSSSNAKAHQTNVQTNKQTGSESSGPPPWAGPK
jgi:hypothetical protein